MEIHFELLSGIVYAADGGGMGLNMIKLLIVDDELSTREVLIKHIPWIKLGVTLVKDANDGINAYNLALEFKPDIIITDIKMPRLNGIELIEQVHHLLPNCKFIILSGYSDKEYFKSAIKLKAVDYLEKPLDLDEIIKSVQNAISEFRDEMKNHHEKTSYIKDKVCLDLLYKSKNQEELVRSIKEYSIPFPLEGHFVTAILWFNYNTLIHDKIFSLENLRNTIDIILEGNDINSIYCLKNEDVFIFHFETKSFSCIKHAYQIMTQIIQAVRNSNINIKSLISLGTEVNYISDIYISYQNAVIALQKTFFANYNEIKVYKPDTTPPYILEENILTELINDIKHQKKTESNLIIKRIVNELRNHENTQPDYIKSFFIKSFVSLLRITEDRNNYKLSNEINQYISKISSSKTLLEIQSILLQLISTIYNQYDYDGDDAIITKIMQYIQNNYSDQTLSVASIAKQYFLSDSYLCVFFKKETGKTVNQYITEVRMDAAMKSLKHSEFNISEISLQSGYNDAKYFSKVFLKQVGMNPKAYRRRSVHE